ncbi:conserved protein of unknown function [Petrocella atlantisensis]|uniref:Uncharacterized protein n=1 Tax=Petrocella atlantisensis TaxID=2173034 RepID=A0A3P7PHY9_9FIRM|nr:hypothetical protein [Petrocella atlantisensis]VDN48538.1 conserved protein of unknown function [Petrocella atlantisensis]
MKILLENRTIIDQKDMSISHIFEIINKTIAEDDKIFSHLVIDSVPINDNFEDYFNEHLNSLECVEIITKTYEENIWDIIASTHDYLNRGIKEMEQLADNFYKTPKVQDWKQLADLFEGMGWILESTELVNAYEQVALPEKLWQDYNENVDTLKEQVAILSVAMEHDDRVTIADVVSYEIVPIFNALLKVCKELMNQR